jgi:hypothetical protein
MMQEDVSGRFDYQFETRWSRRIVHAGVVLATLATATAVTPNVSQPVPTPTQPPSTVASEPPSTMPPPPATRAPLSVGPESRAPFPNQAPSRKNDQGSGLVGGLP